MGSKYSMLTHIFHEPRKPQKKRTYAHKRFRHGKKEDAARDHSPNLSYEKTENFDTYDAIPINFDKN